MSDNTRFPTPDTALTMQVSRLLSTAPDGPDIEAETARILAAASVDGVVDGARALELAAQRARGVPIPHLLGRTTFMGLELTCLPEVFATREETELLGWKAIEMLRKEASPGGGLRVIDIGSGAGNLTCAIAKTLPDAKVWAVDIDAACVALTRRNVEAHALTERVVVRQGDLFAPLADCGLEESVDAVVCNPPYIASIRLEKDRSYLVANEPKAAFDGGPFGISVQLRLIKDALLFLRPGGWLIFEFGLGQDSQVRKLIERTGGYDLVDFVSDQHGQARVSLSRKQRKG